MAILSDFSKKNKKPVKKITTGFLPRKVTIPVKQEDDFECTSLVKAGDVVKEGQVIAEVSKDVYGAQAFGAAKIHSPIPGVVTDIKNCNYPNGKHGKSIEIALDGSFTYIGKKQNAFEWNNYSPAMILRTITDAGVINTFKTSKPSSLELEIEKLREVSEKKLFVRLFDEDPSCETDSILTRCEFEKIATGIFITAKVCEANEIIIAFSKDSKMPTMLNIQQKDLFGSLPITFTEINTRFYPAGEKRELINAYIKQKKIQSSHHDIEKNSIFTDSNTMYHVYNAVVLNKPVETVNVFVNGDCLQATALLKVAIGTSFNRIAKQCGAFSKKLGHIVVNGMINGVSVNSLSTPVTKYVKSISFISEKESTDRAFGICLRCGRCRQVCDTGLCPDVLYSHKINGTEIEQFYLDSALLCSECGACNSVCPSKLPLTQIINILKEER